MATCQIGNKIFQLWQVIAGVISGVLLLVGSAWGVLEAEDRWNQIPICTENAKEVDDLELDMAAMQKSIQRQDARNDLEFWKREVFFLKEQLRKYPNDRDIHQQLQEALENYKDAKTFYEELKKRK